MTAGRVTDRRASLAARQLLFHRERLRWMAGRMENNADAVRTYLVARGREAAVLPGGYAGGLADDGEVVVSGPRAAEGYEQLEIPEILEVEHD